jgi:hypothetical protein
MMNTCVKLLLENNASIVNSGAKRKKEPPKEWEML